MVNFGFRHVTPLAIALAGVCACSSTESGSPIVESTTAQMQVASSTAAAPGSGPVSSSSSLPKGNTKTGVDPCSFLTVAQLDALGSKQGKLSIDTTTLSSCNFAGPPSFGIGYFSDRPYRQRIVNAKPIAIAGGRAAVMGTSVGDPACAVSLELTPTTSMVVSSADGDLSETQRCKLAKLVAQTIEPNLPRG